MTETYLPRRADIERACKLCGLIGSTPKEKDVIYDASEKSERTTRADIQYGKALGLIKEEENGINATNRGIDLYQSKKGEARRESLFREATASFEPYATLVSKLTPADEDRVFERRDVDRHIRVSIDQNLKDNPRQKVATLFLQTLEAAGVGRYIRGRGENPARLEIENHEALDKLLNLIQEEPPTEAEYEEAEEEIVTEYNGRGEGTDIDSTQTFTDASITQSDPQITLDIQLELDGTEDPDNVQKLVAGIRQGLINGAERPESQSGRITSKNGLDKDANSKDNEANTESEQVEENTESKQAEEDESDDKSPDSSLVDFE